MMLKNIMPSTKKLCNITIRNLLDNYLNFESATLIFVDLETLGVNPTYECEQITEMAAWAINGEDLTVMGKLNYKVRLLKSSETLLGDANSIEREAWEYRQSRRGKNAILNPHDVLKMTKYHKITAEVLGEKDALLRLSEFVSSYDNQILVAHNVGFDMKFIVRRCAKYDCEFPTTKVFDTLTLSRYFFTPALQTLVGDERAKMLVKSLTRVTGRRRYISSRLGDLAIGFGISADNWHTAVADVEMMLNVVRKMIDFFKEHSELDISDKQRDIIFREPRAHAAIKN